MKEWFERRKWERKKGKKGGMKREIKKQKEKIDRNEMEGRMKYGDRKVRT